MWTCSEFWHGTRMGLSWTFLLSMWFPLFGSLCKPFLHINCHFSAPIYYAVVLFYYIFNKWLFIINVTCLKKVEHGMQVPSDVQVPRNEMIHHVSSILQDNGFGHTGEDVDIGNLYCFCTFLVDLFICYNLTYNYMITMFVYLFLLLVCEATTMNRNYLKCHLTNVVCQCLCCLIFLFQDLRK